jgi:hypothetical protein
LINNNLLLLTALDQNIETEKQGGEEKREIKGIIISDLSQCLIYERNSFFLNEESKRMLYFTGGQLWRFS